MTSHTKQEQPREIEATLGQAHPTGREPPRSGRPFEWTPEIWRGWTGKKSQLIEAHFVAQTEAVFALLQKGRPRLVLEAGCGYGRMTGLIASRFQDSSIIAIDLSRAMTAEAQASTSGDNVNFCSATLESLPFRDAQFDAVACVGVIMHVDKEQRALSELLRVVKPGGLFIFTFNNLLNPFAPAFAIYAKLRKPKGYQQRFHRLSYYRKQIGGAAVLQEQWPDLLVPELDWSPRIRRAASRLNRWTSRFGYEPVVMFVKTPP